MIRDWSRRVCWGTEARSLFLLGALKVGTCWPFRVICSLSGAFARGESSPGWCIRGGGAKWGALRRTPPRSAFAVCSVQCSALSSCTHTLLVLDLRLQFFCSTKQRKQYCALHRYNTGTLRPRQTIGLSILNELVEPRQSKAESKQTIR